MKTHQLLVIAGLVWPSLSSAQQPLDSLVTQNLEPVLLRSIKVKPNAPMTHSNVTKADLVTRNLGQDLPYLLNDLPSVVITSDAGAGIGYTGLRIRGVSAQSTNITINGIPYNDAESLGTYWVDLPDFASSVEQLQLQRGVGASTMGTGAFGASIAIQTENQSEQAFAEMSHSVGSFNTFKHTLKFATGVINDRLSFSGRASKISSDGYIDRANADLKSYFIQGDYQTDRTALKAIAFGGHERTYQAWYGVDPDTYASNPRFNYAGIYTDANGDQQFYKDQVDDYQQDHHQLHWQERWNSNWSTQLSLNYTKGRGYYEEFKEDDDLANYDLQNSLVATSDVVRRRWLDNDFYVASLSASRLTMDSEWHFGLFYSYYQGDHFGQVVWASEAVNAAPGHQYYFGQGLKNEWSGFAKLTQDFGKTWQVFADAQWRFVDYNTSGLNSDRLPLEVAVSYHFFNPKLGTTYQLNPNNNFYASVSRANREPARSDFENNPKVKSESLTDFELGWRFAQKRSLLELNAFYMAYEEQLVLTGNIDNNGTPIRDNSGKSYRAGIELSAKTPLSQKLQMTTNLTWSSNQTQETVVAFNGALTNFGRRDLTFSPEWVGSNRISFKVNQNLEVNWFSKLVSDQFMSDINAPVSKLEGYFLNDFGVSYALTPSRIVTRVRFDLLVNNILNIKYISNGYYYSYDDDFSNPGVVQTIEGVGYYPQAGRNVLAGVTLRF